MKTKLLKFLFFISLLVYLSPQIAFAAVGYDGTGDEHQIDNPNVPSTTAFTVCGWINAAAWTDNESLVSYGDAAGNGFAIIARATGYLRIRHYAAGVAQNNDGPPGMATSTWIHFCFVHAGDDMVYIDAVDGLPDATDDIDNPGAQAATDDFVIGQTIANGAFPGFIGSLADVSYWDVALSNAEVASLADKSACPEDVQPTFLQVFTRLTTAGSVTDQSDNAFPVTETGNPTTQSGPSSLPSCGGGGGGPPPAVGGGQPVLSGPWPIGINETGVKIPIKAIDETDHMTELTTVSSMSCYRVKNGVGAACGGSSTEISDVNAPGSWLYTPAGADVDTAGSVFLRFTATGMVPFETTMCVGCKVAVQTGGIDGRSYTYDGQILSVSGQTIGAAIGEVDIDGQYNRGALLVYDANGKFKIGACIANSINVGDEIVTVRDMSGVALVSDNYVIFPSLCEVIFNTDSLDQIDAEVDEALTNYGGLKSTVAGRTLDVSATGAASPDLSNVEGTLDLTEVGSTVYTGMFSVNTGSSYGAAHANSVVKQIADNATATVASEVDANITKINNVAIATPDVPGYLKTTDATFIDYGTPQAIGNKTIRLRSAVSFADNMLANNASVFILEATSNKFQSRCICKNTQSNDDVEVCEPWKGTPGPLASIRYFISVTPECNLSRYPTSR